MQWGVSKLILRKRFSHLISENDRSIPKFVDVATYLHLMGLIYNGLSENINQKNNYSSVFFFLPESYMISF